MAGYDVRHTSAGPAQHVLEKNHYHMCCRISIFHSVHYASAQLPPGGQVPLCAHPTNSRRMSAPNRHPILQAVCSRAPVSSPSCSQPTVAPRQI
jgi:hypothetical protein